jgi:hypothetical protein
MIKCVSHFHVRKNWFLNRGISVISLKAMERNSTKKTINKSVMNAEKLPKIDQDAFPENTCKEYTIKGKHIAICKRSGQLQYFELTPLRME